MIRPSASLPSSNNDNITKVNSCFSFMMLALIAAVISGVSAPPTVAVATPEHREVVGLWREEDTQGKLTFQSFLSCDKVSRQFFFVLGSDL